MKTTDPFLRVVLRAVVLGLLLTLVACAVLDRTRPEMLDALWGPISAGFVLGSFALLSEIKGRRYPQAVLGFLASLLIFPGGGYLILRLSGVPFSSKPAQFVAMVPLAAVAPEFMWLVRRRFKQSPVSAEQGRL